MKKYAAEKDGWAAFYDKLKAGINDLNPIEAAGKKLANTFQLFSPSLMRQCVVCVAGMPKGTFSKYLKVLNIWSTYLFVLFFFDDDNENE